MDQAEHHLDSTDAGPAAIRGGVLRVTGYFAGLLTSLIAASVLLRYLNPADYGRYAVVLQLTAITAGVSDAGLSTLATRELAVQPPGPQRDAYLRNMMGVRIALVVAGAIVAVSYAALGGIGPGLVGATVVMSVALLVMSVQSSLAADLLARLRLGTVTAADLLRQVSTSVGMVALVALGAALGAFFLVAVLGALAALVFTVVVIRGDVPLLPAYDRKVWRGLLANTIPFALAAAVGAIYFRVVILIVQLMSTPEQVGLFGASFRIIEVLVIVPYLVVSSAFPIFARAARTDADRLAYALQRMLDACLILGATIALLLVVGAPVALDIVAGSQYHAADGVLRWHGLALLFSCCAAVFGYGLLSLHAYRGLLAANLAALIVNVVAAVILVPIDGAEGGALSTLAGEVTLVAVGAYALAHARGGARLQFVGGPRLLLAGALAAAPALVLTPLPATIVAAGVFGTLILVLRVVPEELAIEARVAVGRVWRRGATRW